jgi:hypothetical protein
MHGMPVLNGRPAAASEEGTVAVTMINGSPILGVNSRSPGYSYGDNFAAMRLRDILVEKYPDIVATENVGRYPNDAMFHAEATALLRAADANGGTLAGRTIVVRVDRALCDSCDRVLPVLAGELGNPTVTFVDATGSRVTARNGRWLR